MMLLFFCYFFFHAPSTSEFYTLSLHDALPICFEARRDAWQKRFAQRALVRVARGRAEHFAAVEAHRDRKSTRLNSSHRCISYAVFCLKKKKTMKNILGIQSA